MSPIPESEQAVARTTAKVERMLRTHSAADIRAHFAEQTALLERMKNEWRAFDARYSH
jgi:hypothetical protein